MRNNPLKQNRSWAERVLLDLKAAGQSKTKPYVFLTSCVDSTYEDISAMQAASEEVDYAEMAHNCSLEAFEAVLGYGDDIGLRVEHDPCVEFARSTYKGVACYYLVHSRVEYVWVNARGWEPRRIETRRFA